MSTQAFQSLFSRTHDVVVVGSGYSGFAAALALQQAGRQVLLLNHQADVLWESGRCFMTELGSMGGANWRTWTDALGDQNAMDNGCCDGAIAEIVATDMLHYEGVDVLYYATTIAVEQCDDKLSSIIVATKSGLRRVVARQWVDTTDECSVLRLLAPNWAVPQAERHRFFGVFQSVAWPDGDLDLDLVNAELRTSAWSTERRLCTTVEDLSGGLWPAIKPAFEQLWEALPELMQTSVMSHCSIDPIPIYADHVEKLPEHPSNLVMASPALAPVAVTDLSARFQLGLDAAEALADAERATVSNSLLNAPIEVDIKEHLYADVVVAGAGTGGAVAAITAAQNGAEVLCAEPMSFAGGIGSGGGIHSYYYGFTGGFQEVLDDRVSELMPYFGKRSRIRGFHPDAKKLALAEMFREADVQFVTKTTVYGVEHDGGTVKSVLLASPDGPRRAIAPCFIDGTGDGDLCAMAGADFEFGREGDGRLHAYTQSTGKVMFKEKNTIMTMVNFDAGWVDPTDSEDLTRARLVGIRQYLRDEGFNDDNRPTYIAPAIGLRQGRQINTDYVLQLSDILEHRRFQDAVGFSGAHYDNHAIDYEFESDEGMFWVWGCHQWRERHTSEFPYRILLPKGLDNVWIACRAVGVSPDAHYSMRMQRDMQRLGEISGLAAAHVCRSTGNSRDVPFAKLQKQLIASGALDQNKADLDQEFGSHLTAADMKLKDEDGITTDQIEEGLTALHEGKVSGPLWYLYRAGDEVRDKLLAALNDSNPDVSWCAAAVLSILQDNAAEPRLLEAINTRESVPFDESVPPWLRSRALDRWETAISLLRMCGSERCLPVLAELAKHPKLTLNFRTIIAVTLKRLLPKVVADHRQQVVDMANDLVATEKIPASYVAPQRKLEPFDDCESATATPLFKQFDAREDHSWQLHLLVAQIRDELGLDWHAAATACMGDERAFVRRAFSDIQQNAEAPEQPAVA